MSVIMHNMMANFSSRQLNITTGQKAKSAEKLASGYKINRSADDAAGLQISEKMRAQIRGLKQASENARDGISLIQTAEGALNEVHGIMQRMNELAVQAANDTNGVEDRQAIQEEINQLSIEIDRVSDSTEFNKRKILKVPQLVEIMGGEYGDVLMEHSVGVQTKSGALITRYGVSMDFANTKADNIKDLIGKSFTATCTVGCNQIFTFEFTDATKSTTTLDGTSLKVEIGVNNPIIRDGEDVVDEIMARVWEVQNEPQFLQYQSQNLSAANPVPASDYVYIGHANGIYGNGTVLTLFSVDNGPTYADGMGLLKAGEMFTKETTIYLQIGANTGQYMEYKIKTMNNRILNLENLDVSNYDNCQDVIERVQNAISEVSSYRSYMGAMQNRLEHVIANNDNTAENTQAAESRLRDTDMATEMVEQSKYNILAQVGESILAQANQAPQGILSLLQ